MLIGGIALGLVLGLLVGGRITNLASIRLRWTWLLLLAVALRFGTETLLAAGVGPVELLRVPLLATSFAMLLVGLWANRAYPGLSLAFVGVLSNAIVIIVNGGYMPIWEPSLIAAGFTPDEISSAIHTILPPALDASFLLRLGPLSDVIPIPVPLIQNVLSVGDLFLAAGLAFFLFAGVVRIPEELDAEEAAAVQRRLDRIARTGRRTEGTGLNPALLESAALERPLVLATRGTGLASPSSTALPRAPVEAIGRVRRHPYVRLALNGSFSALWAGQLISLFGDRIHQIALVAVVYLTTGSALASGLVFVAATVPNLLLSPVAGTFVDRWDRKEVLVVSDILRAALVLLLPIAVVTNVLLVYPLVFAVTSVSIFFRPARVAILPRIVDEDELLTANSAMWVGETIADVVCYPLAGLFVYALGSAVPLAFWVDAVTYLASAALLGTIVVRPSEPAVAEEETPGAPAKPGFFDEMRAGWRFLRNESVLLANTLQATVAQFAIGVMLLATPIFAFEVLGASAVGGTGAYAFLETGIGVGNLLGGFVIGLIGARFAKGRMVIAGYALWGALVALLALSGNLGLAVGLAFGQGVANMLFVIPSQTLFQQRTPSELMGRVVGFRFALVFGAITLGSAAGGLLVEAVGITLVIVSAGALAMAAGLAGLLVPAVRDA